MLSPKFSIIIRLPQETFYSIAAILCFALLAGSLYILVRHEKYDINGKYFVYYVLMAVAGLIGLILAIIQ